MKECRQSLGVEDERSSEFRGKGVKSQDESRQKLGREGGEYRHFLVPGVMEMRHRCLIVRY